MRGNIVIGMTAGNLLMNKSISELSPAMVALCVVGAGLCENSF
jgi:hypothetical protein